MPKPAPPPLGITLTFLRQAAGWRQKRLAAAIGIHPNHLCDYEQGRRPLSQEKLEALVEPMGYDGEVVELALVALSAILLPVESHTPSPVEPSAAVSRFAKRLAARHALTVLELTEGQLLDMARTDRLAHVRAEADRLWTDLRPCTSAERWLLIERSRRFRGWWLSERLCIESERAAAKDAAVTLDLARMALRVAELAEGSESWLSRLQGNARSFVANGLRVSGQLRAAKLEFAAAWKLWRAGATGDPAGILPEWRLLDLEASLCRDAGQFAEALDLLDRARSAAPRLAVGRILLKRASTLQQAGEVRAVVETLREAAPLIHEIGSLRERFGVAFNLSVNLCHLGRFADAEVGLPGLRELAIELGNELDLVRVLWLTARVAAGGGRPNEARAAFEQVMDAFTQRRNAADVARVSLDLAILHLEQGRAVEVQKLSHAMAWIFASKGITRDVLAALRRFWESANRNAATIEQAQHIRELMEQTQQRDASRARRQGTPAGALDGAPDEA
jgi:transcriptional regulator with XRE-family HTH domain